MNESYDSKSAFVGLYYGIFKNYINKNDVKNVLIDAILNDYKNNCIHLKFLTTKTDNKLDSFKSASCLMSSILKYPICDDKETNIKIALYSGLKMCEEPYVFKNNEYKTLEKVDYETINSDLYKDVLNILITSLHEPYNCEKYYPMLEAIYKIAIALKEKENVIQVEEVVDTKDDKKKKFTLRR